MTDERLLKKGYHEFAPGPFEHSGIISCFQKCFDDDIGKKYFITVHKWEEMKHPHTQEVFPCSYEYYVQLCDSKNENAIDFLFHSSWDVEEVEQHVETLFQSGLYKYYEKY